MNNLSLEVEILSSVHALNGNQKNDLLDYIRNIRPIPHSKRLYRRRAMKQIREALQNS
ncbi:MAG: hypothetical protein RIM99_01555 [Cyclobacteriaceae bacterium]